jgi:hypothetical protein
VKIPLGKPRITCMWLNDIKIIFKKYILNSFRTVLIVVSLEHGTEYSPAVIGTYIRDKLRNF